MSGRSDRGIHGGWTAALLIGVIIATAAAGLYAWRRMQVQQAQTQSVTERTGQAGVDAGGADAMLTVMVYYPSDKGMTLQPVRIRLRADAQLLAKEAVSALFSTSPDPGHALLGSLRLKALYIDHSGTAYVDLSPAAPGGIHASAWQELMTLYAIVNTLTANFEEIKAVRFLLEGKEAQTLAGHISLAGYFEQRQDLIGY